MILTLALVAVSCLSMAQAKVELGLKGGINMSSLSGNTGDNITAYHGGAYGMIKITKFAIQPEALFSKRGTDNIDLGYLDIPIMLKMYLAGGLNVQAGPQFGVLLSKDAKDDQGNNLNGFLKGSDLSIGTGLGLDLPFGLNLTARYLIGVSDVTDGSGPEIKGNTFQFSVGYSLIGAGK